MRNARGDPSRTNSSCSELPPPAEQVIDQLQSFLAIPFLETTRAAKYSLPVVCAQRHHLVLKSAGAELHAGIVADGGEISDGLELCQTNLTVGWIQAADPPILQPLAAGHHLRDD